MRAFALALTLASIAAAQSGGWRTIPLISSGKIDPAWKQVDWGGFIVDSGALRTQPDPRGMGLLVYTKEQFGDSQIRIVYRAEKPRSNSGVFIRIDDGILGKLGEKTEGVQREADNKLSPAMVDRMKASSEKQIGAWYAVHHGFEVQIDDAGDAWHRTGSIYSLAQAESLPVRPQSDWRTMIITLEGDRVTVDVDAKTVTKFVAPGPLVAIQTLTLPVVRA